MLKQILAQMAVLPLFCGTTDGGSQPPQPHIHFPFHSSCKSNLADFFCLHIFLSPSHPLSLASLIVSCRSTSHSLINYLKNIHCPGVVYGFLRLLFVCSSVETVLKNAL